MVSNDLVMPLLLRIGRLHLSERRDLTAILLAIRRGTIVLVLLLGYVYASTIGESYALVTIGLVSFVAALQFAPAILAGIYWGARPRRALCRPCRRVSRFGSTRCCCHHSRGRAGSPTSFAEEGPFGIALLRPYALFGLEGLDPISHATIWTMIVNVGLLVGVSLLTTQSKIERSQAVQFVDVFGRPPKRPRMAWARER